MSKLMIFLLMVCSLGIGAAELRLTTDPGMDDYPRWAPDSSKIAFQSDRSGNLDIWVMNSDGSNQVNLSNSPFIDSCPAWSPDGTKIAFHSNRSGTCQIWSISPTGNNLTQITSLPYNCTVPDWSPDGKKLAFTTDLPTEGEGDIYIYDIESGTATPLIQTPYLEVSARWSKYGDRIAYSSDRGIDNNTLIFVYDLKDNTETCLTNRQLIAAEGPCWFANDTKILFFQGIDPHGDLWEVSSTGGSATRLPAPTPGDEYSPDMSPDETMVAYAKSVDYNVDIYTCPYNELGQTKIEPTSLGSIKAAFH